MKTLTSFQNSVDLLKSRQTALKSNRNRQANQEQEAVDEEGTHEADNFKPKGVADQP